MPGGSGGGPLLKTSMNLSNLACCCRKFRLAGLVASFFRWRCMRSWRPFCWGWPGLMRSIPIPRRSHHTASLLKLNNACAEANGTPLSLRMLAGRVEQAVGKVKQSVGETFGNETLANQGVVDQAQGAAKETWGNAKDAAKEVHQSHKDAATDKAHQTRDKTSQSVQNAKKKVNEKIDNS